VNRELEPSTYGRSGAQIGFLDSRVFGEGRAVADATLYPILSGACLQNPRFIWMSRVVWVVRWKRR